MKYTYIGIGLVAVIVAAFAVTQFSGISTTPKPVQQALPALPPLPPLAQQQQQVEQQPVYTQAPAQVIQAPASNDGMMTGLLLGHVLSNSGGSNNTHTIERRTVVKRVAAPRPSYAKPRSASRSSSRRR